MIGSGIPPHHPAAPNHSNPANEWMTAGSCNYTDPEIFFVEQGADPTPAKLVCNGCVVRIECATYAIRRNEYHGIWGGLSRNEREALAAQGWTKGMPLPPVQIRWNRRNRELHSKLMKAAFKTMQVARKDKPA